MEGDGKVRREGRIGELDLLFNDYYERHIFQTAMRLQRPTHTILLGDIFSSEFISLEEFERRVERSRFVYGKVRKDSLWVWKTLT